MNDYIHQISDAESAGVRRFVQGSAVVAVTFVALVILAPMDQLRGHSFTYRITVGPQQGLKVFTLQMLPDERDADDTPVAGNVAGLLRASCPTPFGPACGCSKSLPAILSPCTPVWRP